MLKSSSLKLSLFTCLFSPIMITASNCHNIPVPNIANLATVQAAASSTSSEYRIPLPTATFLTTVKIVKQAKNSTVLSPTLDVTERQKLKKMNNCFKGDVKANGTKEAFLKFENSKLYNFDQLPTEAKL